MYKLKFLLLIISSILLSACISNIWTGANIVYDRHHVYKKFDDIKLAARVGHALKIDPALYCPSNKCFEIAVFHGDVLVLGVVPSEEHKATVQKDVTGVGHYRHFYNLLDVNPNYNYASNYQDHLITTSIRSQVVANADIDPEPFKIISKNNIVYVMGDVMEDQEALIIDVCRKTTYVNKVVNLLQAYELKKHPRIIPPSSTPPFPNSQPW